MKQIGIFNVTRNQLDNVFTEGHKGIAINTMGGKSIKIEGFVIYQMDDGSKSIKIFDTDGRDYYTSSQVFIKNLIEYLQTLDDADFPTTVNIVEEKSQKGRTYYTIAEAIKTHDNNAWRNLTF